MFAQILTSLDMLDYGFAFILICVLLSLSFIDWTQMRLPDFLTFGLAVIGLIEAFLSGRSWIWAMLGVALGYISFVAIELFYLRLRGRHGLGRGDAKLLAAGGAWCGAYGLPFIVLIGSVAALASLILPSVRARMQEGRLPFGPFLSLGIFTVWLSFTLSGVG